MNFLFGSYNVLKCLGCVALIPFTAGWALIAGSCFVITRLVYESITGNKLFSEDCADDFNYAISITGIIGLPFILNLQFLDSSLKNLNIDVIESLCNNLLDYFDRNLIEEEFVGRISKEMKPYERYASTLTIEKIFDLCEENSSNPLLSSNNLKNLIVSFDKKEDKFSIHDKGTQIKLFEVNAKSWFESCFVNSEVTFFPSQLTYDQASDILEKEYSNVFPNLHPSAHDALIKLLMYGYKVDFAKFLDKNEFTIEWKHNHFVIDGQILEIGRDIKMTSYDSCNNGFFAKIVNWCKKIFNKNEDHDSYNEDEELKKMEDSINISNDKNPGTSGDIESVDNHSVNVESTEGSDNMSTLGDLDNNHSTSAECFEC